MPLKIPKPKKRPSRKTLRDKADDLFSLIVRARGKCLRCGTTQNLQCAHVVTRDFMRLRFDEKNAMCLCGGCHLWWHKWQFDSTDWFEKKLPEDYKYLMDKKIPPLTDPIDYDALIVELEKRLHELS